ncbi:sensor histidine kinase [Leptolyngbya sp. FACHB-541]|uniref:sensor histidine kinase n=1 Tax=Leptolyngbya sp. FACHB-541 TaxID=2692810 RepID=UPI00168273CC|nr:sensor histidine kinase [Leptolyngbya sp. FACHB-541]MBD1999210.1 sensor histidine kinase [Leptolyngbya sp. FACHB-541]
MIWSVARLTLISTKLAGLARRVLQGTQTQKMFRYIEWTIIVFTAAIYGLFSGPMLDLVSPSWGPFPFLLIWFALSFIFPSDRPRWQKRLYIFVEIALMIIAVSLGLGAEILMYLFIAKACFLLSRRDVIITAILTGIAYLIPLLWSVPQELEYWRLNPQEVFDPNDRMAMAWVERIFVYTTAVTFVIFLSFATLAERRAQKRTEELVKEVETLGIMLERERIARDIHDTLGHTLTTLGIQLEVAQQIGESDIPQTLRRLKMARYLADQCLQDVRQVVQTMRESNFDLTQALTALITQMQQTQPVKRRSKLIYPEVQLNLPPLPLQTSYQLYFVVQEGVTNIQKHADATQVQLKGWSFSDRLLIELSDNGRGFDSTQLSQGFGLRGMQERVQILGGILQIQTELGRGTRLIVQVPLSDSALTTN